MTEDHYRLLVAMLLDTITVLRQQVGDLTAEVARLTTTDPAGAE